MSESCPLSTPTAIKERTLKDFGFETKRRHILPGLSASVLYAISSTLKVEPAFFLREFAVADVCQHK